MHGTTRGSEDEISTSGVKVVAALLSPPHYCQEPAATGGPDQNSEGCGWLVHLLFLQLAGSKLGMNTIKQPEDPREPSNMFFLPLTLPSTQRTERVVLFSCSSLTHKAKTLWGEPFFFLLETETADSGENYMEGLKVHLRMDHIPYPMSLKAIVQKLKQIKIRKLASRLVEGKKAPWNVKTKKKRTSRKVISHGHHVVEKGGSVLVQRGEVGLSEVWLFGAFDQQMGDGVVRFLQSHLFEKLQSHLSEEQLSEKQIARNATETMKNAYDASTPSMQPNERGGSATALLVNGERVVAANFGGYKAVLCEGGKAIQLGSRRPRKSTDIRLWFHNVISEKLFGHGAVDEDENTCKGSLVVDAKKVGSKAEFIILASYGVWEVLRDQEAVDLIRHIEDAQEEAKCLADEAMARMTKSAVTCIVIRFK